MNELCLVADIWSHDESDHNPFEAGLENVSLDEVYRKRKVCLKNTTFPGCTFREHTFFDSYGQHAEEHKFDISCSSELTCRWVSLTWFLPRTKKPYKHVMRRLTESEADPQFVEPETDMWSTFRGGRSPKPGARLKFGDGFCGCGGVSEGAAQAGINVYWSFDNNEDAIFSYRLNRANTTAYLLSVDQFKAITTDDFVVDILHLSFPCQAFSAANFNAGNRDPSTRGGQRDEANQAALFCVAHIIRQTKPRVVTVEQTSGIQTHHPEFLRSLVNEFTSLGFSCRWKIWDFAEYGLPQKRKRLILIASCPGGVLPDFPEPTHGNVAGRMPFTTIQDWLKGIRPRHDNQRHGKSLDKTPYDPNRQLKGAIVTNGSGNKDDYHPSGQRGFTIRELARLQTLPLDFRFGSRQTETSIKTQIGNLVPVVVAKRLLEHIKEVLETEDEEWRRKKGRCT